MAMDSDTLQTASTYVNNLLLARGLLRDSKSIDFAKPTRDTRAQIINLVHDLVLRRDRDQESREHIAHTLRTLRSEQSRKDTEIARLRARLEEKDRSVAAAQAETRAARSEVKKVEREAKTAAETLAKLKTNNATLKTQCANEVRKRDVQIERLKAHLQGQQRGNKGTVVAPSITVTGGNGLGSGAGRTFNMSVRELEDPEYSLKQETNDFLTQLSQSLSDENDGLIAMLRSVLAQMKELLGVPEHAEHRTYDSTTGSLEEDEYARMSGTLPVSYDTLVVELEHTMGTLKTLLTNPNFVTMEEVEVEGNAGDDGRVEEKMESTGDTINLDDLRRGLGLGVGLESPSKQRREFHRETAGDVKLEETDVQGDSGVEDMIAQVEDMTVHENTTADEEVEQSEIEVEHEDDAANENDFSRHLTTEEKLRAAQEEAQAAAAGAPVQGPDESQLELERADEIGRLRSSPAKKTLIKGRPRRRKSTLSPDELDALLGVE
ncbi:hypothetical protein H2203_004413 [Taxawa tesnikishii (nom. ined.)]|nr:hypothetical protein H2203_004413 [Dothideales sp. JES 119]